MFNKNKCFGIQNEITMLPIIREFFNDSTISKTPKTHCPFDYESSDTLYELKTRNNCYNRYPDTIFPCKKFTYLPDKNKILIFSFTDGNYYIKYIPELFETFHREKKQYRFDRGPIDQAAEYVNIPITSLIKMERV